MTKPNDPPCLTPEEVVACVRQWIGTPYHHQASRKAVGCDCLGLVRGVWREIYGREAERPPPYSRDWAEASRTESMLAAADRYFNRIKLSDIQLGDVVVFRLRAGFVAKHTGILTSDETMVHAMERSVVSEVALGPWWRRRLAGAFRFPGVTK